MLKNSFLRVIARETRELTQCLPNSELFAIAHGKFVNSIARFKFPIRLSDDALVISHFAKKLEKLGRKDDEDALWALVFVDLWFCSNFHDRWWERLIHIDKGNAKFAVEHAYYVMASSGSDGWEVLEALLDKCRCGQEMKDYYQKLFVQKE